MQWRFFATAIVVVLFGCGGPAQDPAGSSPAAGAGGTAATAPSAPGGDAASVVLWRRECSECHPGPNLEIATDRIWLDQIQRTN